MKALFDTNILIDHLNGIPQARDELAQFQTRLTSIISWMAVLVGCREEDDEAVTRRFLEGFDVIPIDSNVAERAVVLRRTNGIRLPDALIQATAERNNALLDTRNTKDFPSYLPGIRVPYEL